MTTAIGLSFAARVKANVEFQKSQNAKGLFLFRVDVAGHPTLGSRRIEPVWLKSGHDYDATGEFGVSFTTTEGVNFAGEKWVHFLNERFSVVVTEWKAR